MKPAFLYDQDVERILRISHKTLKHIVENGPARDGEFDLRKAMPINVGRGRKHSQRRWPISKFAEVVGMTRDQVWEIVG